MKTALFWDKCAAYFTMRFEMSDIFAKVGLALQVFYLTLASEMMLMLGKGFIGAQNSNIKHKNI
jgi:hypothetical protein